MTPSGLHILLTYQCNFACDHCFVWGHPWQTGTLTLPQLENILDQAVDAGIERIYFEGGEPGLYYATLVEEVRAAKARQFWVGIVSNGYWATSTADARAWLKPLAGLVDALEVSRDIFHWSPGDAVLTDNITAAAEDLGISMGTISIAGPAAEPVDAAVGQLQEGEWSVMFRGRAAANLAGLAEPKPWRSFTECPFEDLGDMGRVHVDPLGNIHICQGIVMGNLFEMPLKEIFVAYDADRHPIAGPLLAGGPAGLASSLEFEPAAGYADACHLCYEARLASRNSYPAYLKPDQMYGEPNGA